MVMRQTQSNYRLLGNNLATFSKWQTEVTGVIYESGHHPKNLSTLITDLVHQVQQTFATLMLSLFVCFHEMQSLAGDNSSSPPVSHTAFPASFCTWICHGKTRYLRIIWAGENQLHLMGYLSRVKIILLIIDIHVNVSTKDNKEYI